MITLQFSTQSGPISASIRKFTHAWCSHVDVVMPEGGLLGAHVEDGVRLRPHDYAKFTKIQLVDLIASDQSTSYFHDFVRAQLGKPYDTAAIAAFVMDRNWQDDDKWFCSELVCAGLIESGVFPVLSSPSNRISPADLMLVCSVFTRIGKP